MTSHLICSLFAKSGGQHEPTVPLFAKVAGNCLDPTYSHVQSATFDVDCDCEKCNPSVALQFVIRKLKLVSKGKKRQSIPFAIERT